jgi:formimidoylglutamate deiminase
VGLSGDRSARDGVSRTAAARTCYRASIALLPDGFARDAVIAIDATGAIEAVETASDRPATPLRGIAVPGMPDLHSHAFQRAMAGLSERAGPQGDDFWSWRETMYRFLARLGPEEIEAIAAQLHVELLKHGYTAIAEFHYLYNDPAGRPYADPAEQALRIVAAARASGIGLTLLPVLYQTAQFGGAPATDAQRRFVLGDDAFFRLVERLHARHRDDPQIRIGAAPHSLRAVTPPALAAMLAAVAALDPSAPIHIHAAEQEKEVADCIAWSGARPVEWLLAHAPVDRRWCLVHCTHANPAELAALAASQAVAGLCPTTEANLGDGIFALPAYLRAGGRFGIGTDANIAASPAEELRWLEYAQRLVAQRRNLAAPEPGAATGAALYQRALAGGAQASGRPIGAIAPGCRADIVVLDPLHPALYGRAGDTLLDAWIFAGLGNPVRDVMVGGAWVVRDGAHRREAEIAAAYRAAIDRLAS